MRDGLAKRARRAFRRAAFRPTMTLGTTRSDAASDSPSIDEASDADLLGPLLEGTVRNLQGTAPAAGRTGPVARGDEDPLVAHLEALRRHHPGLLPVYAALTTETVRLAARTDRLSSAAADRLLDRLERALTPPGEPEA